LVLEAVVAAVESGGENKPVVGERRRRWPILADSGPELVEHMLDVDDGVGGDAEREPGVVVDEGEDLDSFAGSESSVGEVGLPGLVGQLGLEAQVGGSGSLLRFGDYEAVAGENFPDR
jgi:hypothetical protein